MNYIIEVHRTYEKVRPVEFATMLDMYIGIMGETTSFDVYETVNELAKDSKTGTITGVKFGTFDIDTRFDTYHVSLDVPKEQAALMHEGRGNFIPKINDNGVIERLDYVQRGGQ